MAAILIVSVIMSTITTAVLVWYIVEKLKPNSQNTEKFLGVLSILSLALFLLVLQNHSTPYFADIDPFVEPCYSPISYKDSFGLILVHLLSVFSLVILYIREYKLPPILIVVFISIVCMGILVNSQFLYHISSHDTSNIHLWSDGNNASLYLSFYPVMLIVNSIGILIRMIKNKSMVQENVVYKNTMLNWINHKLINSQNLPLISILLTAPFLILIILILTLIGQDIEALTRVYTETATWKLSQHVHPPTVDDRHGHYLCTVAAHGNPKIVKPLGIGQRHGKLIMINRQLQIANAFECLIENKSPKIHKVIRTNYDKYGINLAKRINNERLSNWTYMLMKPFEWIFLAVLYSCCIQPEELIKSQYKSDSQKISLL